MTDQKCLASEIVSALGGAENVTSASYCMTRLRVYLEDESLADDEKIKSIEGVKGLTKVNDHYQVIIGSEVKELYPKFKQLLKHPETEGSYCTVANEIVDALGGGKNLNSISHCMTRLRVYLEDENLVNDEAIEDVSIVKGFTNHDNYYQIVVGTEVADIFPEVEKLMKKSKRHKLLK